MPAIDELFCNVVGLNTGQVGCSVVLKAAKNIILLPVGTEIDDTTTPKATLEALLLADNPAARAYMLPAEIQEVTDNTSEPTNIEWAYGAVVTQYYGIPNYTFMIGNLSLGAMEAMQQFNGKAGEYELAIIDQDDQIIMNKYINDDDETVMRGFSLTNIFTGGMRIRNKESDNAKMGTAMQVVFSNPKQFNEGNALVWKTGIDLERLPRMNTLTLSQKTAPDASRIVDIKVMVNSRTNFASTQYRALLAVVGAWKGSVTVGGAALTVSAVSIVTVSGDDVYRVTFAATNYPSSPATFATDLQAPSVLAALTAPLKGFESAGALTLTPA